MNTHCAEVCFYGNTDISTCCVKQLIRLSGEAFSKNHPLESLNNRNGAHAPLHMKRAPLSTHRVFYQDNEYDRQFNHMTGIWIQSGRFHIENGTSGGIVSYFPGQWIRHWKRRVLPVIAVSTTSSMKFT